MDIHSLSSYKYELPLKLIAQEPIRKRDECKLFVIDRKNKKFEHKIFENIIDYIKNGDCIIINISKVISSRLLCKKTTGAILDILFLKPLYKNKWYILCKKNILNKEILLPDGKTTGKIIHKTPEGEYIVEFQNNININSIFEKYGLVPLPKYIKRETTLLDKEYYQTVYAKINGSVASPTAGLHFTNELISKLKSKGVLIEEIVLHINWGTFKPIRTEKIENHKMDPEEFFVSKNTIDTIKKVKKNNNRIFAVGTSCVRVLETLAINGIFNNETSNDITGQTDLFIYPEFEFKVVDCLITNFHLPASTPFVLTSAFAELSLLKSAYKIAIENKYRFYSYGDCMLIL